MKRLTCLLMICVGLTIGTPANAQDDFDRFAPPPSRSIPPRPSYPQRPGYGAPKKKMIPGDFERNPVFPANYSNGPRRPGGGGLKSPEAFGGSARPGKFAPPPGGMPRDAGYGSPRGPQEYQADYREPAPFGQPYGQRPAPKFAPPREPAPRPTDGTLHRVRIDDKVYTGKDAIRELVKGVGGKSALVQGGDGKFYLPLPTHRPGIFNGTWEIQQIEDADGNRVRVVDLRKPVDVVKTDPFSDRMKAAPRPGDGARRDAALPPFAVDSEDPRDEVEPRRSVSPRGGREPREMREPREPGPDRSETSRDTTPSSADSLPPPNVDG